MRDDSGTLVGNPKIKAELLQKQYQKVFSDPGKADIAGCMQSKGLPQGLNSSFNDLTCNEIDIVEALKELDPYSAAPDGEIPARILTTCRYELAEPLKLFWCESFSKGYIPGSLKEQFITPLYKKGDRTNPANYRPVSLTS